MGALTWTRREAATARPAPVHCIECDARIERGGRAPGADLTCALCGTELVVGERRGRRRRRRRPVEAAFERVHDPLLGIRRCAWLAVLCTVALVLVAYPQEILDGAMDLVRDALARLRASSAR